jgi:hypothetical protein
MNFITLSDLLEVMHPRAMGLPNGSLLMVRSTRSAGGGGEVRHATAP